MIKVDLRKAYASVEWIFLEHVMFKLGFPQHFNHWVMACVCSISFNILINGRPGPTIKARRGLHQGDPMSPYMFAHCLEYFSRQLANLKNVRDFSYHPRCRRLNITHLMFADDLLLFAKGNYASVHQLRLLFDDFSHYSRLSANTSKSCLYVVGIDDHILQEIRRDTGMNEGSFPFCYLGIPLHSRKLNSVDCKSLVDQIIGKIRQWSVCFLSYAGRLKLIKSVIAGMTNFWYQIFTLLKKIIRQVNSISSSFLWSGQDFPD